ncbi:ABC transporter permease [Bradyrhizobium sp. AZCC 2289]|uniref:ABC transporter permease n=1 Tax=Bradyrhizobium sp. AZCC 2289 TaxID=3117026 RepID=UPI002FF3F029
MRSRAGLRFGFRLVFWRELRWLRRRYFLLALTTLVPLGLMALLIAIFSAGLATRLPIGVLDLDHSDLSRTVVRMVDATPDAAVDVHVGELAAGRQLIQSGQIYGLLMLPKDLQRDVFAGRRPEVVFFYNTQKMTSGNIVLRGVSNAVPTAAAGIRLSLRTEQGQPADVAQADLTPIPVQTNALFNPTLNYVHFLLAALLPSLLQIVIVTTSSYSAGMDIETNHRLRILRRLGGGLWPAVAGKLLPYTILYLVILLVSDSILFHFFDLPLRGSGTLLLFAGILFILACQLIGTVLALVLKPMASAVSIGSLLTAPAFGYMGVSFPRHGMNAFAYEWGEILPGTWYLMARIDQTIRGTPLDLSWKPVFVLCAIVTGLAALLGLLLETRRKQTDSGKRPALDTARETVP